MNVRSLFFSFHEAFRGIYFEWWIQLQQIGLRNWRISFILSSSFQPIIRSKRLQSISFLESYALTHTLLLRKATEVVARSPPWAQPPSGPLSSEHNMLWIRRGKVEAHSLHVISMRSVLQGLIHCQVLDPCEGHAIEREAGWNRRNED